MKLNIKINKQRKILIICSLPFTILCPSIGNVLIGLHIIRLIHVVSIPHNGCDGNPTKSLGCMHFKMHFTFLHY